MVSASRLATSLSSRACSVSAPPPPPVSPDPDIAAPPPVLEDVLVAEDPAPPERPGEERPGDAPADGGDEGRLAPTLGGTKTVPPDRRGGATGGEDAVVAGLLARLCSRCGRDPQATPRSDPFPPPGNNDPPNPSTWWTPVSSWSSAPPNAASSAAADEEDDDAPPPPPPRETVAGRLCCCCCCCCCCRCRVPLAGG